MEDNSFSSSSSSTQHGKATATVEIQCKRGAPPSALLHGVRKPPAKPCKKPKPPRVYCIVPRGFRQLVQKLTGQQDTGTRCLRDAAPAPLDLVPRSQPTQPPLPLQVYEHGAAMSMEYTYGEPLYQLVAAEAPAQVDGAVNSSGLQSLVGTVGFLSPSLCSPFSGWCSFPLLSPRTMASLEQSTSNLCKI